MSPDTRRIMTDMGHRFRESSPWSQAAGIMIGAPSLGGTPSAGNRFYGVIDPRRNMGLAQGF